MIRLLTKSAKLLRRACSSLKPPEELLLQELDAMESQARAQQLLAPQKVHFEQARLAAEGPAHSPEEQRLYRRVSSIRTEQGLQLFFEEHRDSLEPSVLTVVFKQLFELFRIAKRGGDKATVEQFLQRESVRPVFQVVVGNFKQLPPFHLGQVVECLVRNGVKNERFFSDVERRMVGQLSTSYCLQEDKLFRTLALLLEAGHPTCFDSEALALVAERALSSGTFDSPDRFAKLFYQYHRALRKLCDAQGLAPDQAQRADFVPLALQLLPQLDTTHATKLLTGLGFFPAPWDAKTAELAQRLNATVRVGQLQSSPSSRPLSELAKIVLRA